MGYSLLHVLLFLSTKIALFQAILLSYGSTKTRSDLGMINFVINILINASCGFSYKRSPVLSFTGLQVNESLQICTLTRLNRTPKKYFGYLR